MPTVRLKGLQKIFPGKRGTPPFEAVKTIDLDIGDGEFMVLVGPSGCGKTTTLRMIAGLEEVSAGTIEIDGRVINDLPPKDRDIAMVFQNYALYPHMTVFQNMAFGLKLRKLAKTEIEERVHEAAQTLGIEALLDRMPKALSGGQRQRVAVGRAIVRKPKVFLFDEPLSNLDAKTRASTRMELSRLHAKIGATMIYVTHDQVEAMTMGDRICVLNEGNIMQIAEPLALYNRPANLFVASFIGTPSINLLKGRVVQGSECGISFKTAETGNPSIIALGEPLAKRVQGHVGKELILGIRPESIRVVRENANRADCIETEIENVEPMGNESLLYLKYGNTTLTARVPSSTRLRKSEKAAFAFDLDNALLFDPESEAAL